MPACPQPRSPRRRSLPVRLALSVLALVASGLVVVTTTSAASAAPPANNAFPIAGYNRNSSCANNFGAPRPGGRTHQGLDCFAYAGAPLIAAESGTIRYAISEPTGCGSGNRVSLRGASGYRYYYGHLLTINVSEGQTVQKGDLIGTMGQTGNAHPDCGGGGVHLHFEVAYLEQNAENPWTWMGSWVQWAAPRQPLEGYFDGVTVAGGNAVVRGWAFQPSAPTATTSIQVAVNESSYARTTGVARPDVVSVYSLPASARPGFETSVPIPGPGSFQICVTAISGGSAKGLGCKPVTRNAATLASGLRYQPITPARLGDVTLAAGQQTTIDVTGVAAVRAASATLTAVNPGANGFLTAWQCGARPETSSVNYAAGAPRAGQAIVPLNANGALCLYSSAATRVLVDVNGWMRGDTGYLFNPVAARRGDTRLGTLGGRLAAGETRVVTVSGTSGVPAAATSKAATLNLTVVNPAAAGHLRVWNCAGGPPTASSLNYLPGQVVSASISSALSAGGQVCVYSLAATDLVMDVQGWYGATGRSYRSIESTRIVDTRSANPGRSAGRNGASIPAGGSVAYAVGGRFGIPAAAAGAVTTVAVPDASPGYVTTWNCGTRPGVSHVNYDATGASANFSQVATNASSQLCSWTSAASHLVVDLAGIWQ